MFNEGLIRIGMILACLSPSLLCFGSAAYLMSHGVREGWGWLLLIGTFSMDVPRRLLKIPQECPTCKAWAMHQKPEPAYEEVS